MTVSLFVMLVALAGLPGCALLGPAGDTPAERSDAAGVLPAGTGWWYARFSISRPDGGQPHWHIGALLGGEVIAPVFERHHGDILIWRVHRRAGNDAYGHVFSFIFYSTAAGAQRIYADLENSPVVRDLRRDGIVTNVMFDDPARLTRPGIGDTSDTGWSQDVQQTWPAFAMGVSRMWLDMVGVIADRHADEPDLEQRYLAVHREISDIWAGEGQHALLHHLSALFGYQPLLITY